jgi:two-component system sensor histidine kinase HydH
MNIFPRPRLFYVSPWLLAAATALLVLIVVTFTAHNIRREKELMIASMLQKAETLIRIVHSGSRSAYFSDLRKGVWKTDPWQEYVQRVINHVVEDPEVKFIVVVDDANKVIVHNDQEKINQNLHFFLPGKPDDTRDPSLIRYRISTIEDEGRVFEAVRDFYPYRPLLKLFQHNSPHERLGRNPGGQREMLLQMLRQERVQEGVDERHYYVLVGLDMSDYDQSLRRIRLQAVVLSLIMLLVGLGGWFSLAAVQGYRVSQRTLGEMKLFTNLLLAKLPVGIIATDRGGCITTFNDSAAAMTGVAGEDALGGESGAVLPEVFAEFFTNSAQDLPSSREKEIEIVIDGGKHHYLCHMIAVQGGYSDQRGRVLLISDLTQLKGLEREMRENERLAAVGRMAAGVAHEVRNPLSSIKGLALLLKGRFTENSSDSETAELLIEQVERMNRTVSELLSFARPAPLNLQSISLKDLLEDIIRLIETDAGNNSITTRLEVAPDLQNVAADRDRLNQVFINLLLNSIQAMEQGGELTVSARNSDNGNMAVIQIHDTGCGIPPENISQLFYPYFTTRAGGTGIGLAISQKIISDHKGSIRVDSTMGQGTTVTVELPAFRGA